MATVTVTNNCLTGPPPASSAVGSPPTLSLLSGPSLPTVSTCPSVSGSDVDYVVMTSLPASESSPPDLLATPAFPATSAPSSSDSADIVSMVQALVPVDTSTSEAVAPTTSFTTPPLVLPPPTQPIEPNFTSEHYFGYSRPEVVPSPSLPVTAASVCHFEPPAASHAPSTYAVVSTPCPLPITASLPTQPLPMSFDRLSPDSSSANAATGVLDIDVKEENLSPAAVVEEPGVNSSTKGGKKKNTKKRKSQSTSNSSSRSKRHCQDLPEAQKEEQRQQANIRERERTKQLNTAFTLLRGIIPTLACDKLSKIQTLKLASLYLTFLIDLTKKGERGEEVDWQRYDTKDKLKANFNYWRSSTHNKGAAMAGGTAAEQMHIFKLLKDFEDSTGGGGALGVDDLEEDIDDEEAAEVKKCKSEIY